MTTSKAMCIEVNIKKLRQNGVKFALFCSFLKASHSSCFCAFLMLLCTKTGYTKRKFSKRLFCPEFSSKITSIIILIISIKMLYCYINIF